MQVTGQEIDEERELERSKPADYSFKKLHALEPTGLEQARSSRLGAFPERGTKRKKFLTKSIWLNNNKLKSTKNLEPFVDSILEFPELLAWLDLSFNHIRTIDESILKFPNLKIVYLHGNCIENLDEIFMLRGLRQLKTVTFHGNPISNDTTYRRIVVCVLQQISNLDFTPVLKSEKVLPPPPEFSKLLREKERDKKTV